MPGSHASHRKHSWAQKASSVLPFASTTAHTRYTNAAYTQTTKHELHSQRAAALLTSCPSSLKVTRSFQSISPSYFRTQMEAPHFLTEAGIGPLRCRGKEKLGANASSVTKHMNEIQPGEWEHILEATRCCAMTKTSKHFNKTRHKIKKSLHSAAVEGAQSKMKSHRNTDPLLGHLIHRARKGGSSS